MDRVQAHRTDIQKLAEKDKIKGGLKSIQDRDPIEGGFTPFETGSFAPNSNAGAGTDGGIDPEDPNSFAEPDPSDPNNPNNKGGTNNRDPNKDGPQDADDILDDTKGPTLPDGSVSDPFSGGSLNKITGLQDCDTGQCVTAHLDGKFDTPDGWTDPNTPPVPAGYESGYWWSAAASPPYLNTGYTSDEVIQARFDSVAPSYPSYFQPLSHVFVSSTASFVKHRLLINNGGPIGYIYAYRHNCNDVYNQSLCDTTPGATEWPPDGCYDVAMIDGQLQTNQYDSEAPASAKETRSAAVFCTSKGKKAMIRAAANGGTMVYQVTSSGAPTGIVKVYNSNGTLRSAGDASQQNIDSQLPK